MELELSLIVVVGGEGRLTVRRLQVFGRSERKALFWGVEPCDFSFIVASRILFIFKLRRTLQNLLSIPWRD